MVPEELSKFSMAKKELSEFSMVKEESSKFSMAKEELSEISELNLGLVVSGAEVAAQHRHLVTVACQ